MPQITGRVRIPAGKKVAVNIGCDVDAQSIWIGSFNMLSPAYMSRGEFGAEVGVPRLLKLLDKHDVKATWCIPDRTVDTWPDMGREILAAGHEIAHHGYVHENPTLMALEEETKVMEMGLESLARIGAKPRGYRSPYWDFSPNTLNVLERYGFEYDSSLMGNDLYPYRPARWKSTLIARTFSGRPARSLKSPSPGI